MADRNEASEIAALVNRFVKQRQELGDLMWPSDPAGSLPSASLPPSSPAGSDEPRRPAPMARSETTPSDAQPDAPREAEVEPEAVPPPPPPPDETVASTERERSPGDSDIQVAPEETPPYAAPSPRLSFVNDGPLDPPAWAGMSLEDFGIAISGCVRCALGSTRTNFVFGVGNPDADIMFVGEAPGADEDAQGIPFVGRAGQLLTKMIEAMKLSRDDVYIANILKCRPPNNRNPMPAEVSTCIPYLKHQIELLQPRFICALGRVAAQTLLETNEGLGRLRGKPHRFQGVPVVVTYHPAALLRNPNWKRPAWDDLRQLRFDLDGTEL
jgi:uracil-DNA glycosylase